MGCGASTKYKVGNGLYRSDSRVSVDFLATVPLLKSLPPEQLELLGKAFVGPQVFQKGEVVFKQGDPGREFYIIRAGRATVSINTEKGSKVIRTLEEGDFFGEKALIRDEHRTATVTADSLMSTVSLAQDKFQEMGLHEKVTFSHRKAIGREVSSSIAKPASTKTASQRQFIAQALRDNTNLQHMVPLDDDRIQDMIDICWLEHVAVGTNLIQQGDANADYFYVVEDGQFEISVVDEANRRKGQNLRPKSVRRVGRGSSFGEMALLVLSPRTATVKAIMESRVWVFDRDHFKEILMKASTAKIKEWTKCLDKVELLNSLSSDDKMSLAQAFLDMHFVQDELIFEQGMAGVSFFILIQGTVSVIINDKEVRTLSADIKKGETATFGEKALLNNSPRTATIKVVSEVAKALVLDRDSFVTLLGPLEERLKRSSPDTPMDQSAEHPDGARKLASALKNTKEPAVCRADLRKVGLLGCGAFGVVELFQDTKTEKCYAIKSVHKGYIVKKQMQQDVFNEKNVMMMADSPFVIKLYGTYVTAERLHFIMELALGGELYATYERKGLHGDVNCARFYSAGAVCAFKHLHDIHVIYRDLKPENLMLTAEGHVKLCDFGLAKYTVGITYTVCGTPDYFAPEVIESMGYNHAVDWWGLGIMVYELMSGNPPFEADVSLNTYSMIQRGIDAIEFPKPCLGAISTLIKGLLAKDPAMRLPMRAGGIGNVKNHMWYAGFDWDAFEKLKMEPPFVPLVGHKTDLRNFNASPDDMPDRVQYVDDGSGWDKGFATMQN